jgi:hypothetical protein
VNRKKRTNYLAAIGAKHAKIFYRRKRGKETDQLTARKSTVTSPDGDAARGDGKGD